MEKNLHSRTPGRDETPAESGDRAPAAEIGSEIVTVCAWCPTLHILKLQRRDSDVVIIYQQAKRLMISRNGMPLTISHGICPNCKDRMK